MSRMLLRAIGPSSAALSAVVAAAPAATSLSSASASLRRVPRVVVGARAASSSSSSSPSLFWRQRGGLHATTTTGAFKATPQHEHEAWQGRRGFAKKKKNQVARVTGAEAFRQKVRARETSKRGGGQLSTAEAALPDAPLAAEIDRDLTEEEIAALDRAAEAADLKARQRIEEALAAAAAGTTLGGSGGATAEAAGGAPAAAAGTELGGGGVGGLAGKPAANTHAFVGRSDVGVSRFDTVDDDEEDMDSGAARWDDDDVDSEGEEGAKAGRRRRGRGARARRGASEEEQDEDEYDEDDEDDVESRRRRRQLKKQAKRMRKQKGVTSRQQGRDIDVQQGADQQRDLYARPNLPAALRQQSIFDDALTRARQAAVGSAPVSEALYEGAEDDPDQGVPVVRKFTQLARHLDGQEWTSDAQLKSAERRMRVRNKLQKQFELLRTTDLDVVERLRASVAAADDAAAASAASAAAAVDGATTATTTSRDGAAGDDWVADIARIGAYVNGSRRDVRVGRIALVREQWATKPGDTGSSVVQVAVLTERLKIMDEHFKAHKKDKHALRQRMRLLHRRRALMKYMRRKDFPSFEKCQKAFNISEKEIAWF